MVAADSDSVANLNCVGEGGKAAKSQPAYEIAGKGGAAYERPDEERDKGDVDLFDFLYCEFPRSKGSLTPEFTTRVQEYRGREDDEGKRQLTVSIIESRRWVSQLISGIGDNRFVESRLPSVCGFAFSCQHSSDEGSYDRNRDNR